MRALASSLARKFCGRKKKIKGALVLALVGELGAGKTAFVQGFLRALGVRQKITSPTFVLMKKYPLRRGIFRAAYHIDCYRLKSARELSSLNFQEILKDASGIILIEWAEKIKKVLPKSAVWLEFSHGAAATERTVQIRR